MLLAEASPQLLVGSADKVVLGVGSGIGNFEVCGEHGGEPIFKVVYNCFVSNKNMKNLATGADHCVLAPGAWDCSKTEIDTLLEEAVRSTAKWHTELCFV
jgi:hypothetical protein